MTLPWKLTRTGDGPDRVSSHWTHAEAVAAMDRLSGRVMSRPQAPQDGRTYGHTLVVTEDPVAARRRALKARRMAARRRAQGSGPTRLECLAAAYVSMVRSASSSTRADFTLAAPGGDA